MMTIQTINELKEKLNLNSGVHIVKPRVIFNIIENEFQNPVDMKFPIPSSGIGSITMLEASILVSILKIIDPSIIFEFGTFLGYSTSLFLNNSNNECITYSLDLGDEFEINKDAEFYTDKELHEDDVKNDDFLRVKQSRIGQYYLKGFNDNRVKLIQGNSLFFDINNYKLKNVVDFVFIDGGHEKEIIIKDTENALKMIGDNGVIVWHDFNSQIHKDVTEFVTEFSKENTIIHIQHTLLSIFIKGNIVNKFI